MESNATDTSRYIHKPNVELYVNGLVGVNKKANIEHNIGNSNRAKNNMD